MPAQHIAGEARNLQRVSAKKRVISSVQFQRYFHLAAMKDRSGYSFYITTNPNKEIFYCGVTNDLSQRIVEHYLSRGNPKSFAGKYYCYWLIYYEDYRYINEAIAREKEVKKWRREKKITMIVSFNPDWKFLNYELFDQWPPCGLFHRKDI